MGDLPTSGAQPREDTLRARGAASGVRGLGIRQESEGIRSGVKAGCHCAKPGDSGHGPVLSLTRKQAGKTVTRIIPAQAGPETQSRFAEYRRFRQLSKMFIEVNDALSEARLATGPPKRWGA